MAAGARCRNRAVYALVGLAIVAILLRGQQQITGLLARTPGGEDEAQRSLRYARAIGVVGRLSQEEREVRGGAGTTQAALPTGGRAGVSEPYDISLTADAVRVAARDGVIVATFANTMGASKSSFRLPLCNSDGSCNEEADAPTPRTRASLISAAYLQHWLQWHRRWVTMANASRAPDLIMLGDSITKSFYVHPEAVDDALFANRLVMGVPGDQTQHLYVMPPVPRPDYLPCL
jgi:hypothetical protein